MVTDKNDPPVLERHRRMALRHHHGQGPITMPEWETWCKTGEIRWPVAGAVLRLAESYATVERDARAAALEEAAKVCESEAAACDGHARAMKLLPRIGVRHHISVSHEMCAQQNRACAHYIRALLPEPPRTGPELAAEHGLPKLAESGAARVPAVEEPPRVEECNGKCAVGSGWYDDACPVHGTKER